jgi:hypothetical protein
MEPPPSPQMEDDGTRTVCITNLNRHMPIREVRRRLELLVGRYTQVIKTKMWNRSGMLGRAFIKLRSRDGILGHLNKRYFLGTVITAEYAHSDMLIGVRRIVSKSRTLILSGIPRTLDKEDVAGLFGRGLVDVRMVRVKDLAFIDFETAEDATAALVGSSDGFIEHGGSRMGIIPSV